MVWPYEPHVCDTSPGPKQDVLGESEPARAMQHVTNYQANQAYPMPVHALPLYLLIQSDPNLNPAFQWLSAGPVPVTTMQHSCLYHTATQARSRLSWDVCLQYFP